MDSAIENETREAKLLPPVPTEVRKNVEDIQKECWLVDDRLDKLSCIERFVGFLHESGGALPDACGFIATEHDQVPYMEKLEGLAASSKNVAVKVLNCLREHK